MHVSSPRFEHPYTFYISQSSYGLHRPLLLKANPIPSTKYGGRERPAVTELGSCIIYLGPDGDLEGVALPPLSRDRAVCRAFFTVAAAIWHPCTATVLRPELWRIGLLRNST